MSAWLATSLGWILPTLAGAACWGACFGRPRDFAAWCAALGSGHLVGTMGLGALLVFADGLAGRSLGVTVGVLAVLVTLLALGSARRRDAVGASETGSGSAWIGAIAVALIAVLAILLALQTALLPTLGWDAWNSWMAKTKAWHFAGALAPALSFEAWAIAPDGAAITAAGWPYPEALPRYLYWLTLMAGGWSEPQLHLAWFGAWLALGAALFGSLRREGVATTPAAVASAALLSLPMVTAHVALAGYADLWLAALVLLAVVHAQRWSERRDRRDALAALVCAALLPMIKAEGAVWLVCLLAATALGPIRWRLALATVGIAVALWGAALPWGGVRLPLPALGWVRLGWGEIEMAKFGRLELTWQSVGSEVLQTLFLLPNWSLLWYVAPIIAWLGWRAIPGRPGLRMLTWFLALSLAFLAVLFLFTDASAWAENFTSVNRVLLHAVPATVFWLSLLWARRVPRDRSASSAT